MTPRRRRREGNSLAPGGSSENSQPDIPALEFLIRWLTTKRCGGTLFFSVVALKRCSRRALFPRHSLTTHILTSAPSFLQRDDGPGALR